MHTTGKEVKMWWPQLPHCWGHFGHGGVTLAQLEMKALGVAFTRVLAIIKVNRIKILRKNCVNRDDKILRNHKNHKNLVSMRHIC